MLFNLQLLENRELQELFVRQCEQVMQGIEKNDQSLVSETYMHLSAIIKELRRRGM